MRFLKWFIGLAVVVGLLLTLAPFAVKRYMIHWLEERGYHAQIKHLGMDFIFGEITLYDVDLRDPRGEGLRLFTMDLDVRLLPLLEGRLVIDEATIDSAHIDGRIEDGAVLLAGFDMRQWAERMGEARVIEVRSASLVNTELCHDFQARCLRVESASVSDARISKQTTGWTFMHGGPLILQKAFLRDQSANTTLFYGGELAIDKGQYAAGAIDVTGVRLQNIQFIENELDDGVADAPYQTQIGELFISSLQWLRKGGAVRLDIGTVEATSVRQAIQRNKSGQLLLPKSVQRSLHRFSESLAADDLQLTLEQLMARDGALAWTDYSVSPPAMERLSAVQLKLGTLDTALASAPTPFTLAGKIGREGAFKFEGSLAPFAEPRTLHLSGLIESLGVEKLSGYTLALLDQRINAGLVDVAIEASAKDGQVEASSRWQWSDFDIEPARGQSRFMPLELAYDLLKDHNDSLRFSLDITGASGSDSLSPRHVLGIQARQILSDMARGQVSAAGANGTRPASSTQRVAFAPLYYSVNARHPMQEDQQRLAEMASMLKEKSHLTMTFCPVSTGGEWATQYNQGQAPQSDAQLSPEQHQSLLHLAQARGKTLQSSLLDQGVAANQVVICEPRVDMTQSGLSFITVAL